MKTFKFLFVALSLSSLFAMTSCKSGDSKIKESIETAIKANPDLAGAVVEVKDGIATLTGELKDDQAKTLAETTIKALKGVKSVINNCTVTAPPPPPPASITTSLSDVVMQQVKDGLKDIKGVAVEFKEGKAFLSGAVSKMDRMKIMQILASAKVLSDVSKLTNK